MHPALWTGKTGLNAMDVKMSTISNNLANVNTVGFKRNRAVFEDLLYQAQKMPGAQNGDNTQLPTGLQLGTGVRVTATQRQFTEGSLEVTNQPLDMAINGRGFFRLLMPDGEVSYTRNGQLQLDQNGQLVTAGGYPLQPPINIPENALQLDIARDGTVSVTQPGAVGQSIEVGQLQLGTFVNTSGLQSMGENLYVETDSSGQANLLQPSMDGAGLILQEYNETSNVNVAE